MDQSVRIQLLFAEDGEGVSLNFRNIFWLIRQLQKYSARNFAALKWQSQKTKCWVYNGAYSLFRMVIIPKITSGSLFRRVILLKGHYSEKNIVVNIPKDRYSENIITIIIPKVHYSENNLRVINHYSENTSTFIIPKILLRSLFRK